jgi:hypothetical protein
MRGPASGVHALRAGEVDALLYDTYSRERHAGPMELILDGTDQHVAPYTW